MDNYQKELYLETAIRGEAQFPIGFYKIDHMSSVQILPYHWHREFEILYMRKGAAMFQIDEEAYELKEGQAIFINGGRLHSGTSIHGQPCSYEAIVFDPEALSGLYDKCHEYLNAIATNRILLRCYYTGETLWEQELLGNLSEISSCLSTRGYGYQLAVKGRLMLLFSILLANDAYTSSLNGSDCSTVNIERLKKVILYIQEHYQSKITIDELAEQLNMSRHYFCKFFKKATGMTPIDYINSYKIDRAAVLLKTADISIMEAGMEAGFDNFSYFIRTFKKFKNLTPSDYRRQKP
jgi:AraC-like DNA-binding protein